MTSPSNDARVAEIAGRLTKAQREALSSSRVPSLPSKAIDRTHYALMGRHQRICHRLVREGLMDVFTDSYGDRHSGISTEHRFACTPLGLAVRAYLKDHPNGQP